MVAWYIYLTSRITCTYLNKLNLRFRDKDGYHWLTGRVDDVINVR
jgi:acyl-coenzyme A synthetase/AMP-(fatty) acid ligase